MVVSPEGRPILVTGASGRTGRRIVGALADKDCLVRALVRRPEAGSELRALGAAEIAFGDFADRQSLRRALHGVGRVLHICAPMHPQEDAIARTMVDLAGEEAVEHFVLYSVLHPLLTDVPHHRRKLEAERNLVDSRLSYTILQPCRYMQHLNPIWQSVLASGLHAMPFSVSARFSVVDLADVAEAAARVLVEPGHDFATYQLAGPELLSQADMAEVLTDLLGRPIRAVAKSEGEFRREAAAAGLPAERIETMTRMNAHYDRHGLAGNPSVLRWLIGREPTRFRGFVRRELMKP
jgi:uncharacterized protein YbjT (DUF2867 family)